MSKMAISSLRRSLWTQWLAAFATMLLVANLLNRSATQAHPAGRPFAVVGMLVWMASILAVRCALLHGLRRVTTLTIAVLVALGGLGEVFRWVPGVVPAAIVLSVAVLALALFRPTGLAAVAYLLAALVASLVPTSAILMLSGYVVRCDPRHPWICQLEGLGLMSLLVLSVLGLGALLDRSAAGRAILQPREA
jgi:hypothetical protein